MALATVAELASNLTGGLFDAAFPASLLAGVLVGIAVVWVVNRFTRRAAHEQAAELIEVARREAVVGAGELRQKAESEIQEKRAELNREFDRREIESDIRLREIKAHEESLGLLDFQLEQRQERLNRESAAIRQARDAIRDLSKNVRKRTSCARCAERRSRSRSRSSRPSLAGYSSPRCSGWPASPTRT